MSDSNRKTRQKAFKSKSKQRKRKSRLTREYQQNEREVQVLLENTSLSIDLSNATQEGDNESHSVEFFCKTGEEETIARDTKRSAKQDDDESDCETEESVTKTSSEQSEERPTNQPTASTFIQIELVETPVTLGRVKSTHNLEEEWLYKPDNELNGNIKLFDQENAKPLRLSTKIMLNRYYEEAKANDENISAELVQEFTKSAQEDIKSQDTTLYRTYCDFKFHPIFCKAAPDIVEIPTRKFIKLFIKELRFTDHPQLGEEHRLVNLLEDLSEQYTGRLRSKLCEKLNSELQTERRIVNDLLKSAANDRRQEEVAEEERRALNLEHHLLGVRTLRTQLYEEEAANKRLLKDLLDNWIRLKNLRKKQEFQSTRFKLRLQVVEESAGSGQRWTQRFETDLNEIYREELELYYRCKRLWKKRDRSNETALIKPKKPDIVRLSEELKERMAESLYAPGEPKVKILRSEDEFYEMPQTSTKQLKLKSFFMKIYFDRQFVGLTRSYRLEPDLRLSINEAIGIFLERRLPKDIQIELFEKSKLATPKKIANIIIPLPLPNASSPESSEYQMQSVNFSSHKLPLPISGRLRIRFQCDEQIYPSDKLSVLFPPPQEHTKIPKEMLKEWHDNRLLPIATAELGKSEEEDDKIQADEAAALQLTCTFEEQLLQYCSLTELLNNPRFKLLRSRSLKNDTRTKDLQCIPSLDNELEFDWDEQVEAVIEAGNWMDPLDLHKHQGKKYMKSLYEAIGNQCNRLSKVMENSENLLIGDEPASWSGFFQLLFLIFHPRRPLNPLRNSSTLSANVTPLSLASSQNFNIVFNVVRGTGIPVRSRHILDTDSRQRSSGSSSAMFMTQNLKYSNVRPFIVLSYKDKLCRTMTAEGSNPTWNEQLVLQLSGSLTDLRDDIKISLFDEMIENHHMNDELSVRNMDIYQRIQTNWLGEYRVPMNTILGRQKLEGIFELATPKVLIGYRRPSLDNLTTNSDSNIMIDQYPEIKENLHLWFYISLEPAFELPRINTNTLECSELLEVRQHLSEWSMQVRELQPQRFIEPLVCTAEGKRVCMTRLLEPIPLPIEVSENLLDSVCRFVSLMSVLKNYDPCLGYEGIWLNNQILLDSTWGSPKDLGLLLCNFILTIGVQCWLVLGLASPFGESAFVLYRNPDQGDLLLIDACTGKRYSVKDVFCPLNKINYVLAQDNIFCNIQRESRVAMTNFNFNDTSCWLPAFSKKNPAPLGGVQRLNYNFWNSSNTAELRKNIERKVMKKMSSWRTMRKTIWNRAFQPRLQSILQDLERINTFVSSSFVETKYTEQLAAEFPSYKIYGFTLNFPYTNLTSISDRIKSTGLHLNSDLNVEFSLAVHIHSYPNNILSIWLFLISIVPM